MFILREKEVNVGRQRELDLVKGFLMIMIIFIHSFQTIGNMEAVTSNAHMVLFTLFMPTGACLYLFAMGFGSVFTRHSKPEDMVKNGVKLLLYQGLSNLCYAAAIVISFGIRNLIAGESAVCSAYVCKYIFYIGYVLSCTGYIQEIRSKPERLYNKCHNSSNHIAICKIAGF